MRGNRDYFEEYLEHFPDVPSLVLVRSAELKNFPREFLISPILDLCCGDGFFAASLGLKNIYGCDISEKAIKLAQKKNVYCDLKVCDARKLPYNDNSFNSVFSNCAIEHIENVDLVLSEVSRVLTKGGYFIMTVPSNYLLDSFPLKRFTKLISMGKIREKLLADYNKKQNHVNILSFEEWNGLLSRYGLKVIKTFYIFDEKTYKIAVLLDWLLTLRSYNILNRFFRLIFPAKIRKAFWRRFLKKYYLSSVPLEKGGELVIIAKNEK